MAGTMSMNGTDLDGVGTAGEQEELVTLEEIERRYVRRVLEHCEGNRSRAARILGISRRAIYDKMDRLGLRAG